MLLLILSYVIETNALILDNNINHRKAPAQSPDLNPFEFLEKFKRASVQKKFLNFIYLHFKIVRTALKMLL